MISELLLKVVKKTMSSRAPDFVVGEPENLYLERWYFIPRNNWFNVYFHRFRKSDDDRALHDHPYYNMSFVLEGGYMEHLQNRTIWRSPGKIVLRKGTTPHRIELKEWAGDSVISLFICGPRYRKWGFHCPQGWKYWEDFVAKRPGGNSTGPGCEN